MEDVQTFNYLEIQRLKKVVEVQGENIKLISENLEILGNNFEILFDAVKCLESVNDLEGVGRTDGG